ncbi:MAG: TIR domain-containing protein [Chloroflexi bacterium]|nr:TIR domain-containing protein [Chloroflexota bacterium]MBI3167147.1 TIR domain-containing protein [Chloroflexota bacterium]
MKNQFTTSLRVFLCHVSEDKSKVRSLYNKLVADGFDTWLDEENLLPGQEWQTEIPKAVRNSDIVIICLSRKFTTKEGYGQKEIKIALDAADEKPDGTIFLIPAKLEECKVPERLIRWQWVDLTKSKGYEKLKSALTTRANQLKPIPLEKGDIGETDLLAELSHAKNKSQWSTVIRLCDQLLTVDPINAELYITRAQAYYHQNHDSLAILDSIRAIELNPKSFLAYQIRADAYRMKQLYQQSVADASMSIKLKPNVDAS